MAPDYVAGLRAVARPVRSPPMRDRETIDSELRLVAALRRAARERGGPLPSIHLADALLYGASTDLMTSLSREVFHLGVGSVLQGERGRQICYFVIHAVAWTLADLFIAGLVSWLLVAGLAQDRRTSRRHIIL